MNTQQDQKQQPTRYGEISQFDERFTNPKYKLKILHDTQTDEYLLVPDVKERFPGEFGVCAFNAHLTDFKESQMKREEFDRIYDGNRNDRYHWILGTIALQVYEAFEVQCFENDIMQHEGEVYKHGVAVTEFLEFCEDCATCRHKEIGITPDNSEGFIPLEREDGRPYCDARQQQLCAVLYSMRRIEERMKGKRKD